MTADEGAVTCFLKGGTCIDYVVCSPCITPYILSLERELEVPWSPHCGLRLMLALQPRAVLVRSLKYPKDADKAFELTKDEAGELWKKAVENTKDTKGHQIYTEELKEYQKEISDKLGMTKEAEQIGEEYAQWCTTLDEYMKLAQGVTDNDAKTFFGRGKALNFAKVPYLKENCTEDVPLRGGAVGWPEPGKQSRF